LPAWVNFTVGRSDPGWNVTVQVADASTGADRYSHASDGADLAEVVEEALRHFQRWAGKPARPPKLAAPGAAERRDEKRRRKDAS
jgi:hypothetical protein